MRLVSDHFGHIIWMPILNGAQFRRNPLYLIFFTPVFLEVPGVPQNLSAFFQNFHENHFKKSN